jgi:hypothetical protein
MYTVFRADIIQCQEGLTEIHNMISADGTIVDDDIYIIANLLAGSHCNNVSEMYNGPHAHKETAFHLMMELVQTIHQIIRIHTFLTSNLFFPPSLSAFFDKEGVGGSTSMSAIVSYSLSAIKIATRWKLAE